MPKPIVEELHIDCPTSMAFDLMADVRNITTWNRGASSVEMTTGEPIGIDSRFTTVNRGQELVSTITTFDRPGLLEFDVTGKAMDVSATFEFQDRGPGTTLLMTFSPRPKGLMTVLFPVLRPLIRRDLAKQHGKFAEFCQQQAQARTA